MFYVFLKKVEPIAIISVKKTIFGLISGKNEAKIDQNFADDSYMVSVIIQ